MARRLEGLRSNAGTFRSCCRTVHLVEPRMTVGDIIGGRPFEIHIGGAQRATARRPSGPARVVGLNPDHINRYPHQFSVASVQRIGIARGLALRPRSSCDEPVSALDVSVKAQVINLFEQLQDDSTSTHLHRPRPVRWYATSPTGWASCTSGRSSRSVTRPRSTVPDPPVLTRVAVRGPRSGPAAREERPAHRSAGEMSPALPTHRQGAVFRHQVLEGWTSLRRARRTAVGRSGRRRPVFGGMLPAGPRHPRQRCAYRCH